MIFELYGAQYNNEQEIIDAGVHVIYWYCRNVMGRWRGIEHLMVEAGLYGYYYAKDVIKGRHGPKLETLYLMRHSGYWVERYIDKFVRYGNV